MPPSVREGPHRCPAHGPPAGPKRRPEPPPLDPPPLGSIRGRSTGPLPLESRPTHPTVPNAVRSLLPPYKEDSWDSQRRSGETWRKDGDCTASSAREPSASALVRASTIVQQA